MSADTGPCEPSIADVRSLSTEIAALLAESKSNPQHSEDQLKPQSTDTALPQNDFNSNSDAVAWDQRLSKLAQNIDKFQEIPQLIDPALDSIVPALASTLLHSSDPGFAALLYLLCKVRGPKVISRFFPSSVSNLSIVTTLLDQDPNTKNNNIIPSKNSSTNKSIPLQWQSKYCLLLWLSVLVLAPFALDSFHDELKERLYQLALTHISVPGKERDAASILMARLITRNDMKDTYLPQFMATTNSLWPTASIFFKMGALRSISIMCNLLDARTVYQHIDSFLPNLIQPTAHASPTFDSLVAKCLGRIAFCYLETGLGDESSVEDILDTLFTLLSASDTIVRLAASKAIANITQRLPNDLQADVIDVIFNSILEDLPPPADPIANQNLNHLDQFNGISLNQWHGSLLLIAELLQRKLKLSYKYSALLSIIQSTLIFEQRKLTYAVGSNVRDAACYVCWALFRSSTDLPDPIFDSLIDSLVAQSCFDRDINIRRAASAAIQEGIGRHRDSTKGIPLVQALDFFKLGNRDQAYLSVSSTLFDLGFSGALIPHLLKFSLFSWDQTLARLACRALGVLSQKNTHTKLEIQRFLFTFAQNKYYSYLDNIFYALGEIFALNGFDKDGPYTATSSPTLDLFSLKAVSSFSQEDHSLAEGYVHFLTAVFATHSINLLDSGDLVFSQLTSLMLRNWYSVFPDLTAIASKLTEASFPQQRQKEWLEHVATGNESFIHFMCALNYNVTELPGLLESLVVENQAPMVVKCTAIKGLGSILMRFPANAWPRYLELFTDCLNNYTVDRQGDIGSWIRKEAIIVCTDLANNKSTFVNINEDEFSAFMLNLVKCLVRISVELLDNLRLQALSALQAVPIDDEISNFFKSHDFPTIVDAEFDTFFATIVKFLDLEKTATLPPRQQAVSNICQEFLRGFVYTSGARYGSETILKRSFSALITYLSEEEEEWQLVHWKRILGLSNLKQEPLRIAESANRLISQLLEAGAPIPSSLSLQSVYAYAFNMHINTKSMARILPSIKTFSSLALLGHGPSLTRLVALCGHRYPTVRVNAAESLFQVLSEQELEQDSEVGEGGFEDVIDLVASIDWCEPLEAILPRVKDIKQRLHGIEE